MSLFRFPSNGFQLIEKVITDNPKLLDAGDWHSLPYGTEAMTEEEIMRPYTRHCLAGWIIVTTPRAAAYELMRMDVDDFANEILIASGRLPIPSALFYSCEESMRITIFGRAAEERAEALSHAHLNLH